ncbi:MAG: helix-turn-helix transcriptional regulator [Coriobacteriaceae bacterium]|nr:helix-turn-helix transcriptional regulator [Coriobacteriaceae bacterium]
MVEGFPDIAGTQEQRVVYNGGMENNRIVLYLIPGLGALWSFWLIIVLFPGDFDVPFGHVPARVFTLAGLVGLLGALALWRHRKGRAVASCALMCLAAALLSLNCAFAFFGARYFSFPSWAYALSCLAFGCSEGLGLMLFLEYLALLDVRQTRKAVTGSVMCGTMLYLGTMLYSLEPISFGVFETALALVPLPSYLLLRRGSTCPARSRRTQSALSPIRLKIPRIGAVMVVFGLFAGVSLRAFDRDALTAITAMVSPIAVLALLAMARYLRKHGKVSNILSIGQLSVVAGTLSLVPVFLFPTYSLMFFALFTIAYIVFFTTMLLFFSTVSRYQDKLDISVAYAIALVSDGLGVGLGNFLHPFVGEVRSEGMGLLVFAVIAFFIVAAVFFFNKHSLFPVDDQLNTLRLDDRDIHVRCIQLSMEHGLTPREEEVFILLVRGNRVNSIADALVVSQGTVRTHVHRIYEKLGVHSNNDMMGIVTGRPIGRP